MGLLPSNVTTYSGVGGTVVVLVVVFDISLEELVVDDEDISGTTIQAAMLTSIAHSIKPSNKTLKADVK